MNKKGFVLVETIVTSVFVLGLFVFIFANILPLIGDYDRIRNYDTIESIYDTHMIKKMILKSDMRLSNLFTFPAGEDYYLFEGDDICFYLSSKNYCMKLLSRDYLDVRKIIITKFDVSTLKEKTSRFERATAEYIKHMPKYNNTSVLDYSCKRRIIVEFNDGRFANAELLLDLDGGATC